MNVVRLRRVHFLIAGGIAALVIFLGGTRMVPGVTGVFHDDAIYVITAKALAEGDGYRLINLPGEPAQTKYPILYPAALALIWTVWPSFPDNLLAMQWFTLLCAASALSVSFLYLVRFGYAGSLTALSACALAATAPFLLHVSVLTLSEMPFALLVVVALWQAEIIARETVPAPRALAAGLLIGLPFLCRTIGLPVVVAILIVLALRQRQVLIPALGTALVALPWIVWSSQGFGSWNAGELAGYYTEYAGAWTSVGLPQLGSVAGTNALLLPHAIMATSFAGANYLAGSYAAAVGPLLVLAGAATWLAITAHARRLALLPCALLAYGTVCVLWPWPPLRFVLPILSLLLVYLSIAMNRVLSLALPRAVVQGILIASVSAGLATNMWLDLQTGSLSRDRGYPHRTMTGDAVKWTSFEELFAWIRLETDSEDVLASGLDTMLYAYTGRKSIRPFTHRPDAMFYGSTEEPLGNSDDLVLALDRWHVRFVVVTPMLDFFEGQPLLDLVEELSSRETSRLTAVFDSAGGFAIYLVNAPSRSSLVFQPQSFKVRAIRQ